VQPLSQEGKPRQSDKHAQYTPGACSTTGIGASIIASALRLPLHPTTALQHWRQEACEDSDVMLRGHTGPRWYARPMFSLLGFRIARHEGRIQALGRFHIGGVACCVWALPPNAGGAAHRHVQAHSCHVEYPTMADAVIETGTGAGKWVFSLGATHFG
jgi:hypothetical protein